MVCSTVAFNAANISTRNIVIRYAKINLVTSYTHLRMKLESASRQVQINLSLKWVFRFGGLLYRVAGEFSVFCVSQKLTKKLRTLRNGTGRVDVRTFD